MRERWGYATREDGGADCRGKSIPQREPWMQRISTEP